MAIKKIPCGGFRYDDETVEFVDGVMKAKGASKEVTNAIETGGLGWTESEPKEGFDITWDGNTEGLDIVEEQYFKVANNISGVASGADLLGATMIVSPHEGNLEITEDIIETITEDKLITTDNKVYGLMSSLGSSVVFIALEDGTFEGMNFTKGVWFIGVEETLYVSRLYKEASTEEVVHKIDQKYIPSGGSGGGGMVVHFTIDVEDYSLTYDHTVAEVKTALKTTPISAYLTAGEETIYLSCGSVQRHGSLPDGAIVFYVIDFNDPVGSISIQIYETEDGTWSNELLTNT